MAASSAVVLEVAVFTVREPRSFDAVQRRTHDDLATLRGYRRGLRLRGLSEGVFADIIAWESLEAAKRASALVQEDPRFAPLVSAIDQLRLYAHYQPSGEVGALIDALGRSPRVEIAAYAVRDVAAQLAAHSAVHEACRTLDGYIGGAPAQQIEDPSRFADLLGWSSVEAHHHAGAVLQARSELSGFFSGIAEMTVFELFSVVR